MRKIRRISALVLLVLMAVMMCSAATAEKEYELVEITSAPVDESLLARLYGGAEVQESGEAVDAACPRETVKAVIAATGQLPSTGICIVFYARYRFTNNSKTLCCGGYYKQGIWTFRTALNDVSINGSIQTGTRCFVLVEKEPPKTGDATPIALLSVLLAGSAAGIIALRRRQAQGA